jgi:hypothetical protein
MYKIFTLIFALHVCSFPIVTLIAVSLNSCLLSMRKEISTHLTQDQFQWAPAQIRPHILGYVRDRVEEQLDTFCRVRNTCQRDGKVLITYRAP